MTVYVTDDQLRRLRRVRDFGRGGVSKAFQTFLERAGQSGRYDYARRLMPTMSAVDRLRGRLAAKVADGGPPADGGPVEAALTVLAYQAVVRQHPELEASLAKEFARFGLDDLVAAETADVDLDTLLAEADDEASPGGEAGTDEEFEVETDDDERARRTEHRRRRRSGVYRDGDRLEVVVGSEADPRLLLSVADYETFTQRHPDWSAGSPLTEAHLTTITELLRERHG